ncbi:MAG: histidine kinase [Gammaproteobacteria bacterium]|jgi:signal transduction histidine kinase|nr:histidine kinase [Gammaproteobacteria bacterium]
MLKNILHLGKKIKLNIDRRVENFGAQYIAFGIFGILNYPIYYAIWSYGAKQTYESLLLRATATILCLLLLLKNYWPRRLQTWLPTYWYITLTFCMPFFFTFMLFKTNFAPVWLMSTSTIFFWLVLLVDWVSYIAILPLGIFLAGACYYLAIPHLLINENYMDYLAQYSGALILATLFAYNKENSEKLKLQGVRAVGASIAHELRTPLTSIDLGIAGAKEYLPTLMEAYLTAKEQGIAVKPIKPSHYETLTTLLDDLQKETQYSHTIINILLMNAKQNLISDSNFKLCSMNGCISDAIKRYPFKEKEPELIHWNSQNDFMFYGDQLVMTHVIFNLLKNALYFIEAERKGEITLWYETKEGHNILCFKDTAKGIPAAAISKLFDRFYSTIPNGTGLGLSFCKMALNSFEGDITCKSRYREFTQFDISLPQIKN